MSYRASMIGVPDPEIAEQRFHEERALRLMRELRSMSPPTPPPWYRLVPDYRAPAAIRENGT